MLNRFEKKSGNLHENLAAQSFQGSVKAGFQKTNCLEYEITIKPIKLVQKCHNEGIIKFNYLVNISSVVYETG